MPKTLVSEKPLSADSQIKLGINGLASQKTLRATRKNPTERTVYVYNLGLADLAENGELPNAKIYKMDRTKTVINHNSDEELDNLLNKMNLSEARGLHK